MKQYNHLTQQERELIFLYLNQGRSCRKIADIIGRNCRTISREIVRNKDKLSKIYLPSKAHSLANKRRSNSKLGKLDDPSLRHYVISKLNCYWSPEQISGRIKYKAPQYYVSFETIYKFIYKRKDHKYRLWEFLRYRHPRRQLFNQRRVKIKTAIPNRISIQNRPLEANKRLTVGHWETDNMEGKRKTSGLVSVTVDRKVKIVSLIKLNNKKAVGKRDSLINMFGKRTRYIVKSITMDNGTENYYHQDVAKVLNCKTYFCNPYHAWEKGTVENTIGLVRQYLPKGYDLSKINQADLNNIAFELNNRPRKKLQYLTPIEAFNREVKWGTSS